MPLRALDRIVAAVEQGRDTELRQVGDEIERDDLVAGIGIIGMVPLEAISVDDLPRAASPALIGADALDVVDRANHFAGLVANAIARDVAIQARPRAPAEQPRRRQEHGGIVAVVLVQPEQAKRQRAAEQIRVLQLADHAEVARARELVRLERAFALDLESIPATSTPGTPRR